MWPAEGKAKKMIEKASRLNKHNLFKDLKELYWAMLYITRME